MPIIYSYPVITTVNNQDLFVISKTSSGIPETKSVKAEDISTYVKSTVDLNVIAQDLTTTSVNLASQNITITGTANEVETSVSTGQVLQIGLPDSVTVSNNLTVGNQINVLSVNCQGTVEGDALQINTGPSTITGELDKDGNKITNLGDPTAAQDAATKAYVDAQLTGDVTIGGSITAGNAIQSTISGILVLGEVQINTGLEIDCPTTLTVLSFADDTAAGAGGIASGTLYQTDGTGAAPLNVAGIIMIKQ